MTEFRLFPHQANLVRSVQKTFASDRKAILMVLPTGGGKTAIASKIAQLASARGERILFLAHRRELVFQISRMLKTFGLRFGLIMPEEDEKGYPVQVASIPTLARRLYPGKYRFDLIVVDEAHHAVEGTGLGAILEAFPEARVLGVTATPCRLDGRGLGRSAAGYFDALVEGPSVLELIEAGHLARPVVYAPPAGRDLDLRVLKVTAGDYDLGELAQVMDRAPLTGDAVAHYRQHSDRAPALAFCVTVAHTEHVARQFREAGYAAAVLTGETPDFRRDSVIRDLGCGRLHVLASCNVVSEGTDIPIVQTAILLRPTASYALAMQQMGRALRTYPGKARAIILDHAGNTRRHGLPTEPGQWSLENGPRRPSSAEPLTRECPSCRAVLPPAARSCPECAHAFGRSRLAAEPPMVFTGDLEAIDAVAVARERRREVEEAETFEDFQSIGQRRGYKPGWAHHAWRERQARETSERAAHG